MQHIKNACVGIHFTDMGVFFAALKDMMLLPVEKTDFG